MSKTEIRDDGGSVGPAHFGVGRVVFLFFYAEETVTTDLNHRTSKNQSPIISGFAVAIATIGWPLGATAAGAFMKRFPPKRIVVLGASLLVFSGLMLAPISTATPVPMFFVIMFLAGLGLGLCRTVLTILMQNAVEDRKRGIAMSTNALMNTIGRTVFIAIFGAVLNAFMSNNESGDPAHGIHVVFVCVSAITLLTFLLSLRMPAVSNRELFSDGKGAAVRKNM